MKFQHLTEGLKDPIWGINALKTSLKENFLWNYYYHKLRDPKRQLNNLQYSEKQYEVAEKFEDEGIPIYSYSVNIEQYKDFVREANYDRFPYYYEGGKSEKFPEKALEHYLAAKFLELKDSDVYIDIASSNSPINKIYSELYGCETYTQDIKYPKGFDEEKRRIGGNAENLPLDSGFATKMGLHSSFEHFEGTSDIGFIQEAGRVIKNGGKICIVPLLLYSQYVIQTDPVKAVEEDVKFEEDAVLNCPREKHIRHERFYDFDHFYERIYQNLGPLSIELYKIENPSEIYPSCHSKFLMILEK